MKAPRKPLNKKVLIAVGEGVLAVGLLVGAFQIMGNKFSAEAVAENYWEAVSNCDWGSVYDYCEFPESELLTAQNFVNIHADDTEVLKYKSVKFMDAGTKMSQMLNDYRDLFGSSSRENEADLEEMDQKLYYVEYTVKGDSGSHSDEIVVVKTGEKKCLFWDEWKVVPSDFVVQDYEFEVPNNASVTLNGVELSSLPGVKKEYEEGDSWAYLQVPYLFSGEYQLEASREGMETYRTLVDIRYSNDYCYVPELQPSQALIESMAQRAADDVQKLYLAMFNLQPFDTVQDMFSEEALQDEYIRSEYESIVEDFSSMSIASITMDGMTVSVNYLYPDEISFYVDFHYRESYYVNGQLQEEEGNENSYVSYVYENGAWKLSDFDD